MTDMTPLAGAARYRISGLVLMSEVPLPTARALDEDDAQADVVLRLGEVPGESGGVLHRGPNWFVDARRFVLDLPELGRFMAEEGCRLTVCPAPGVPVDDILVFATGTALAAILYQRGAMLLHGSAVVHEGRAFVFCGPSGAGKSTLAAALCRAGCGFVSDDVSAVGLLPDGRPSVQSDGRRLRLFADSIRHAGLEGAVGPTVRRQVPKFHVTPPGPTLPDRGIPLGAVYVLAKANPVVPPGLVTFEPVTAAQALLHQAYRRKLALAYAGRGQPAARTAGILTHAGVHRLVRPLDLARLGETVALLREHWSRLPGSEAP